MSGGRDVAHRATGWARAGWPRGVRFGHRWGARSGPRPGLGWGPVLLLALVAAGSVLAVAPAPPFAAARPPRGSPNPAPLATPVASPVASPAVSLPLAAAIDATLAGEPGVYGVVVARGDGTLLYERNADAPFVAASLYKLVLMAAVHEARRGDLTLDEPILVVGVGETTVGEAVETMIRDSSNEAALALLERVGVEAVDTAAADLGMAGTCVACDPAALPTPRAGTGVAGGGANRAAAFVLDAAALGWVNVTTPRDVARFYGRLLDGEAVNRGASARMLQTLQRQRVDDRFPVLLPKGTRVAHKTGNLPGVVHDAGIVYAPTGPVVLVVLAQDVPDECRAVGVLRRLAALVYAAHAGDRPAVDPPPKAAASGACGVS